MLSVGWAGSGDREPAVDGQDRPVTRDLAALVVHAATPER
jgi:hypothetical protein